MKRWMLHRGMQSHTLGMSAAHGAGTRAPIRAVDLRPLSLTFFWKLDSSLAARFRVARTTCVLLRSPTAALPCFTASIAYSIWWMRPAGLHVVTSVSYWLRNIVCVCVESKRAGAPSGRVRRQEHEICCG